MAESQFPTAQPSITVHNFSEKLLERSVEFQVTRLQGQTFIWVGSEPSLASLAAAVPGQDCPSTALLPGSDQSQLLASRLARKLNKQVRPGSYWSLLLDYCALIGPYNFTYCALIGPYY